MFIYPKSYGHSTIILIGYMYFAILNSFYGQETIDFMYLENQIITDNYHIFNSFCPYSGGIWYMVIFHSFYSQNICSVPLASKEAKDFAEPEIAKILLYYLSNIEGQPGRLN